MGAALVLLLVGFGALAAGVLIGRYYVPDDRQLRRTARHSRAYMRALSHLIARDHETVVDELRGVVEENIEDVEPYFALGAMFRSRGEHERAIRVHQALALRERDKRKLRQRAMYELALDFRAAGMPRRATKAMEEVLLEEPNHEAGLRVLAALYEEQARFNEAAQLWARLGKKKNEDTSQREHHLLVAAAQSSLARDDLDSAKQHLKAAQRHRESAHFYTAAAELAAARGNHRGTKDRLRQALVEDPALAPHLLPGLIAAEEGLAEGDRAVQRPDELDDEADGQAEAAKSAAAAAVAALDPFAPAPMLAAATDSGSGTASASGSASASASGSASGSASASASESGVGSGSGSGSGNGSGSGSGAESVALARSMVALAPSAPPPKLPGQALVPAKKPPATVAERVVALLTEVERETGPRLELSLIRAQLLPPTSDAAARALAQELATSFPDAIAARVAAAQIALASADATAIKKALEILVADTTGALAWSLRGRWQCGNCGARPASFSWRCGQCRRWSCLRMETGIEPPPVASRERRAAPRTTLATGLLGTSPDESLPRPTLDPGMSDEDLAVAGQRRSLLGKVGGFFSNVWTRKRPS